MREAVTGSLISQVWLVQDPAEQEMHALAKGRLNAALEIYLAVESREQFDSLQPSMIF